MLYGSAILRQLNSSLVKVGFVFFNDYLVLFGINVVFGAHSSVHSQDSEKYLKKVLKSISLQSSCNKTSLSTFFTLFIPISKLQRKLISIFTLFFLYLSPFPPTNLHLLQDVTSTPATRSVTRPCICLPNTGTRT